MVQARLQDDSEFVADGRTIAGILVAMLVGAVANAAGVGGGAIFNPLFNALVGFGLKSSTALSQACIAAGSLTSVLINIGSSHPSSPGTPLIDLHLAVVLLPVLLVGVGLGVQLNAVLPGWILTILLVAMLAFLATSAISKGRMLWRKESALKHRSGGSRAKDITGQQSRASHDLAVGTHPPRPSEGDLASEVGGGGGASRRASSCSQASHSSYNTHAGAGLLHAPAKPGQSVSLAPFKSMSSQAGASLGCMEGVDDWVPYQQLVDEAAAVATAVTPHAAASPDPAAAQTHPLQHEGSQALVTGSPFGASPFADPSYSGLGGDASNPRQGGGMGMGLAGMRRASSRFSRLFHALSEIGSVDLDAELDQDLGLTGTGHDGSSTHSSSVFGLASPSSRPLPAGAGGGGMGLGTSTPLTLRNRLHKASSAQLPGMHAEPSSLLRGLDVAGLPSSRAARAMDADGGGGGDGQASWFERRSKWRLTRRTTQALPHGHDRVVAGRQRLDLLSPPLPRITEHAPAPAQDTARGPRTTRSSNTSPERHRQESEGEHSGEDVNVHDSRGGAAAGVFGSHGLVPLPRQHDIKEPLLERQQQQAIVQSTSSSISSSYVPPQTAAPQAEAQHAHAHERRASLSQRLSSDSASARLQHQTHQGRRASGNGEVGRVEVAGDGRDDPSQQLIRTGSSSSSSCSAAVAVARHRLPSTESQTHAHAHAHAGRGGRGSEDRAGSRAGVAPPPAGSSDDAAVVMLEVDMEAGPGTGTGAGAEVEMRPLQHHSTAMSHQLHDYVADGDYDACIDGGSDGGSPSRASKARDGRGRRRRCWPRLAHLFLHLSHSARQAGTRYRAGLRLLPRVPLALLCVCWGVYLALQVARSLSRACSPQYWALFGVQVVLMVGCGVFAAWLLRHLVRRARARARALARRADEADAMEAGTALASLPDSQTEDKQRHMPASDAAPAPVAQGSSPAAAPAPVPVWVMFMTFTAGLLGGLLGLGGGMIMGPLMIHIGVHPQVTSATSSLMVLFSSSTAVVQLALTGRLNGQYAAVFGAASAVSSIIGVVVVTRAVKKSGHPSVVVLSMAGIMLLGMAMVAVFGSLAAVDEFKLAHGVPGLHSLCAKK